MARSRRSWCNALVLLLVLLLAGPAGAQHHVVPLYTTSGLPATPPRGAQAIVTDGGAPGAAIVGDGTNWNCEEGKSLRMPIVTCPPYNAKGDGTTNDAAALNAAITAAGTAGVVILPY